MSANVTIPIGTSDPLDLCEGLPLFPVLGAPRVGASASSRTYHLFDIAILIAITRLKVSAYAGYGFGICGPSIAFLSQNVNVNRANPDNSTQGQLTLTFNNGLNMQAGAFVGAYVAGGLTLTLQIITFQPWYKFWAVTWRNVFTVNKDFKIDLLKLMFTLIQFLLSRSSKTSSFKQDIQNRLRDAQPFVQTYSLDDMAGSSSTVTRSLTATPEVTAPLNLANYDPVLKAINTGLAKIDGEISVGPTVHLQYPVTLTLNQFTIVGGIQGGAPSADYPIANVSGNQVSAVGTRFNILENPSRVTTHVNYQTTLFKIAISIHFKVKVAKFFNLERNTPSLDLTYLLFRIRQPIVNVDTSVSTGVAGRCVLTPNMTLTFAGPNGPGTDIQTGEVVRGTVTLVGFESSSPATVALTIDPPVAGFPSSVTIPARGQIAPFYFTFPNQCLATGNLNDPTGTAPASPISPVQSYLVRAELTPPSTAPCSDYEVEAPLNIFNRFLRCQGAPSTEPATAAPPWDPRASANIKADINGPNAPTGGALASLVLWFPYIAGEPRNPVPITFTLLDENRQPYARSDVEVLAGQARVSLKPSGTLPVTLLQQYGSGAVSNAAIFWRSAGQYTGYSNRFYLVVDAGCPYGQTEFWLDVFNWS